MKRRKFEKFINMWKLSNRLLNNQLLLVIKKNHRETRKEFEMNENKHKTCKICAVHLKQSLGKSIAVNIYIKKKNVKLVIRFSTLRNKRMINSNQSKQKEDNNKY